MAAAKKPPICRHCHKGKVSRPRELCWNCYYTPGVRDLYPSVAPQGRRGLHGGDFTGGYELPPEPAGDPPGTDGRLAVYAARAAAGVALHHPEDSLMIVTDGHRCGQHNLTRARGREAVRLRRGGMSWAELARRFGVAEKVVKGICRRAGVD